MATPTVCANEALFKEIAATNDIPSGKNWTTDVLPIVTKALSETLNKAYEAFQVRPTKVPSDPTDESFLAENAYLMEQLELCSSRPPFTLQRLAEVLLEPMTYHTRASDGSLRGDMLQTALRKCVLATPLE